MKAEILKGAETTERRFLSGLWEVMCETAGRWEAKAAACDLNLRHINEDMGFLGGFLNAGLETGIISADETWELSDTLEILGEEGDEMAAASWSRRNEIERAIYDLGYGYSYPEITCIDETRAKVVWRNESMEGIYDFARHTFVD